MSNWEQRFKDYINEHRVEEVFDGSGEKFDFGEFKSAEVFNKTSTPIARMINKVKVILKNATKAGSKVIIVTARPDFDDKKLFLDTFKKQGIDIDKIFVSNFIAWLKFLIEKNINKKEQRNPNIRE